LLGLQDFKMAEKPKRGRPKGTFNKRHEVVDAVCATYGSVSKFWISQAEAAKAGDQSTITLIAIRITPTLKPRASTTPLDTTADTPSEFIPVVLQAIADGTMATEEAASLLGALNSGQQLLKLEELEAKINTLMESRNA
jgi:hypothetical protein